MTSSETPALRILIQIKRSTKGTTAVSEYPFPVDQFKAIPTFSIGLAERCTPLSMPPLADPWATKTEQSFCLSVSNQCFEQRRQDTAFFLAFLTKRVKKRAAISHKVLASFFPDTIQSSTKADDDLVTLLVAKLVGDARSNPTRNFHSLWLPFLHSLIALLVFNNVSLDKPNGQKIFSAILKQVDCTHETEGFGRPQTLIVTKTFQHNEILRRERKSRLAQAQEQVMRFKQHQLLLLLGPEYTTIVNMEHLLAPLAPAPRPPENSASLSQRDQLRQLLRETGPGGLTQPPVAGVKRKMPFANRDC
ncbi:hypothetical protein NOR_02309 [Metarhizium rileyi]|uniref:Uncharacterized protein n=1 Tax=Metarhizium rileyi (strain RCEF 4871) TaxID=1649241 RepID=A0A167HEI4_METRR|nr:hypothetical protein NOR_02309 [Metarhizium rileyi RCEF 4871]